MRTETIEKLKNHSAWPSIPHTPNPTLQVKYVLTNNFLMLYNMMSHTTFIRKQSNEYKQTTIKLKI